jgi:hypothetical protein
MASDQSRRLAKLEQAITPRRIVGFWDDGITDVDVQAARFRAERGLSEADRVIAFRWRSERDQSSETEVVRP